MLQRNTERVRLQFVIVDGGLSEMSGYLGDILQDNGTYPTTAPYTNNILRIGARFNNLHFLDGTVQSIIIFPSDKTADLTVLHSDIETYYSIP